MKIKYFDKILKRMKAKLRKSRKNFIKYIFNEII